MPARVTTDQKAGGSSPSQGAGPQAAAIMRQALLLPTLSISRSEQLVNGVGGLLPKLREDV